VGTSKSYKTPSGGRWSRLKNDITDFLAGDDRITPDQIIGGAVGAAGGLSPLPPTPSLVGVRPSRGGGGGSGGMAGGAGRGAGAGGRSGGGRGTSRASVGRAVSGLSSFGTAVRTEGLDAALTRLGLDELRGRPATEVIARIAEHLAEDGRGLDKELLERALREAIFEAAALEGDRSYENLSASLEAFLNSEGVEGLVALFLTHFVFERVWLVAEDHVAHKGETASDSTALASAIEAACRGHVDRLLTELKNGGRFEGVDWFGRDGERFGDEIASELEARIRALAPEERP